MQMSLTFDGLDWIVTLDAIVVHLGPVTGAIGCQTAACGHSTCLHKTAFMYSTVL